MRLKYISVLLASLLVFAACSENHEPMRGGEDGQQTYSFTAVLDGPKTRLGYQEDPDSHNLKMVWDEGDVIRLYPDPLMGDETPYYEFVANTGVGTSHTVFVHQGYILNWERWKGKAIYAFPEEDNVNVEDDSEEFLAKAYVQKANDNTEHLKYGEFKPTADGKKSYVGYWAAFLDDANLKMDHKMTFEHKNTVVYKIMLRGFLFDIPGGSELQMSGDAWPDGEVTCLTLGNEKDKEPFLKVGRFGKAGYEDKVLTAYVIRQTTDRKDGDIKAGGKVKFRLLCYDELDGEVIKLDPEDEAEHRHTAQDPNGERYFTNVPWGDEYTWEVELTEDKVFNAGDYVVADLTDKNKAYSNPFVAIDLGLPVKWAAFNVGAHKPNQYGDLFIYGYTKSYGISISFPSTDNNKFSNKEWTKGDPTHDAASQKWGDGWRMPDSYEMYDLMQYTNVVGCTTGDGRWDFPYTNGQVFWNTTADCKQNINGTVVVEFASKVNNRYIYMPLAGHIGSSLDNNRKEDWGTYLTSSMDNLYAHLVRIMTTNNIIKAYDHHFSSPECRAFSLRAVKE